MSAFLATPLRWVGADMEAMELVAEGQIERPNTCRKSLSARSAFFSPRLCGTCLRSVLYPALVKSRATLVVTWGC